MYEILKMFVPIQLKILLSSSVLSKYVNLKIKALSRMVNCPVGKIVFESSVPFIYRHSATQLHSHFLGIRYYTCIYSDKRVNEIID
jgi:hypothetical protein